MSILGLAVEILKSQPDTPVTIDRVFQTADAIVSRLPDLKERITQINLVSAEKAEDWVIGNGAEREPPKPADKKIPEKPAEPAQAAPSDKTESKNNDSVTTGVIEAVTQTGKGFKIDGSWYNITSKSRKLIEPEKGLYVHVEWWQGNSGRLVSLLKAA
jgi:hypothetical protein